MATKRIDNIRPETLRWAFQRAGYSEEKAIEAFPSYRIGCLEEVANDKSVAGLRFQILRAIWLSVFGADAYRDDTFPYVQG